MSDHRERYPRFTARTACTLKGCRSRSVFQIIPRPFQGRERYGDVFRGCRLRSTPGYIPSSLQDADRARVDERVRVDGEQASSVLPLPAGEGRGEGEDVPIIPVFARPRRSSFPPSFLSRWERRPDTADWPTHERAQPPRPTNRQSFFALRRTPEAFRNVAGGQATIRSDTPGSRPERHAP